MIFFDLLTAVFFAFLFGLILTAVLGRRGPGRGEGFLFFFLILFLFVWAGGIWLPPFGPLLWGVSWLNFLFLALFIMLLLAAVIPSSRRPPRNKRELVEKIREEKMVEEAVGITIGYFFWIMVIFLIISIITRYVT